MEKNTKKIKKKKMECNVYMKATVLMISPMSFLLWLVSKPQTSSRFTFKTIFAAVDILDMNGGHPIAYEVKSTSEIKDVYIQDCALQYQVINHHVPLDDMVLIYIDGDYLESLGKPLSELTEENCDIHKLFKMQSILDKVKALQPEVNANIERVLPMTWETKEPMIPMGEQCTKPYQCEFQRYCTRSSKIKVSNDSSKMKTPIGDDIKTSTKQSFLKRLFRKNK